MLPEKIRNFVIALREATERSQISWQYDFDASSVTADEKNFKLTITYRFDEAEEVGRFELKHHEKKSQRDYYFTTTQNYDDYELVRRLFDSAQSSDLNLDLDL